jgi:hypothetical protein
LKFVWAVKVGSILIIFFILAILFPSGEGERDEVGEVFRDVFGFVKID